MNAIFAVNKHGGFGSGRTMPWPRNSTDLQRFREITSKHTVIMGRETWSSDMPTPLPNRRNCVLSTTLDPSVATGCEVYANVTDLLMNISQQEQAFVIGGSRTLWMLRPYISTMFVTVFDSSDDSDTFLDLPMFTRGYTKVTSERLEDHTFDTWTRL